MPNPLVFALALALAAPAAAPPPPARAEQLAWLSGAWRATADASTVEEHWTPPAGGLLLGTGRTVAPGRPTEFEFLRIVERGGGLVYVAQPGGGPPTEFALVRGGPGEAVFENAHHDFPQRLAYRLTAPGALSVRVETLAGDKGFTLSFAREAGRP